MKTREILNKILWDPKIKINKHQYSIQYIHRGVPGDRKVISCGDLKKIRTDSFEFWNESRSELVRIPFHRIEKIFNHHTNDILYTKRVPGESPSG